MATTDFHTHILPGIDDGAADVEQSIAMLQALAEQGVTRVICTPHFYPARQSLEDFTARREAAKQLLLSHPDLPQNIEILIAAEVNMRRELLHYDDLDTLKIPNSDLMLLEIPYHSTLGQSDLELIEQIACNYNVQPVLAHIERYPPIFKSKKLIDYLSENYYLQVDADCLHLPFLKRKKMVKWLKENRIYCIGTDCHDTLRRPPIFTSYCAEIADAVGNEIVNRLTAPKLNIKFE